MGFATGFNAGASAVNAYNNRKRQEMLDKRDEALHEERMAEIAQAKSDRQGMRDAGAERTTMAGTVTQAGGNKYLNADPVQATKMQEMLAAEAEMTGGPAPTQQAGTGITGTMARGHQITTEPVDLKAINGAEARAGRFQAELERQGKPLDAMNMSNAVMENKAKSLGLEAAQLKAADDKFNRDVLSRLDADPDWTQGAAKLLTETQLGGLAGLKVAPVVSADGKTVSFVGTAADGTSKPLAPPMPNTPDGRLAFTQQLLKASPEMKISWLVERGKAEQAAQKQLLEERRVAAVEKNADTNSRKLDGLLARGVGGGGGGGGGGSGGGSNAPAGINMDSIDKTLTGLFSKEDPNTGAKSLNTAGLAAVRQLALRTPAAANGDSTGAALQAYNAYEAAMTKAGGDSAVAMQMLNAAMAPPQAPAQQATPIGASTAPAAAPVTNMRTAVAAPSKATEPKGRVEFQQFQEAARLGYQPTGRGNAMFGAGEVLYINPKTGDRKYASQLFGK